MEAFIDASIRSLQSSDTTILLRPLNRFAHDLAERLSVENPGWRFLARQDDVQIEPPRCAEIVDNPTGVQMVIFCSPDAEMLAEGLMEYVDTASITVIAPITAGYFKHRPLFLISIPKSGTHLLYRLAEVLGFGAGVVCPDKPVPGTWYCLEYSNSHTTARDFFVDTVRRSPFGNRDHPFLRSPAIFIYRNPLDILISEANYYHREGNTAFAGYLQGKSFEERLLTLIDDPWLLGSIRDRVGSFLPWLEFSNVIPVSFEELAGARGGGDQATLNRIVWSVQLKLQVTGKPEVLASQLYSEDSPTFHKGQIGRYRTTFTDAAFSKFHNLPQDFMSVLGYDFDFRNHWPQLPRRATEFRHRPLRLAGADFSRTPITAEYNFSGHNIVKYRGRFHIIPQNVGPVDLTGKGLKRFKSVSTLNEARNYIMLAGWYTRLRGWYFKALRRLKEGSFNK
jgi:hypothetical protein